VPTNPFNLNRTSQNTWLLLAGNTHIKVARHTCLTHACKNKTETSRRREKRKKRGDSARKTENRKKPASSHPARRLTNMPDSKSAQTRGGKGGVVRVSQTSQRYPYYIREILLRAGKPLQAQFLGTGRAEERWDSRGEICFKPVADSSQTEKKLLSPALSLSLSLSLLSR